MVACLFIHVCMYTFMCMRICVYICVCGVSKVSKVFYTLNTNLILWDRWTMWCFAPVFHGGPYISGILTTWWRHQIETFSALLAICARNSPVPGEFPAQRPVTRSFDVFFDLRLNNWLSKQSWGWWFETLSRPLWRHCNEEKVSRQRNS